jgi:hypothetical protein
MLLQTVEQSNSGYDLNICGRFYDKEILKELCGCLINVVPGKGFTHGAISKIATLVVPLAHYTVSEFLNSERISGSSVAYFALPKNGVDIDIMKTVFTKAPNAESYKTDTNDDGEDTEDAEYVGDNLYTILIENFSVYCVISAILLLYKWTPIISQQDDLSVLAFNFLDPSAHHFEGLAHMMWLISEWDFFPEQGMPGDNFFWYFMWDSAPTMSNSKARTLFNILVLTQGVELARKSMTREGTAGLQLQAQTRLTLESASGRDDHVLRTERPQNPRIDGACLAEIFGPVCPQHQEAFNFLLVSEIRGADPSAILLSYIGCHEHNARSFCKDFCPVQLLLQRGADPNGRGYWVTPLQIAVASWDYEGVDMLLSAGADPNGLGDGLGIKWEADTLLSRFNFLYNLSPLWICQMEKCTARDRGAEEKEKIEATLLQYRAKSFCKSKDE